MPLPKNVSVILNFAHMTVKTSSVRGPSMGNTCVSFDTNPFCGSGAIAFTRFPWPSLPDHDLENVIVAVDLVVSNCDKFVKTYVYTFCRQVRKCLQKYLFDHMWSGWSWSLIVNLDSSTLAVGEWCRRKEWSSLEGCP